MIAQRVATVGDVEDALLGKGFEPTEHYTATGRYWKHSGTGRHLLIPQSVQGYYPDWMLQDLVWDLGEIVAGQARIGRSKRQNGDLNKNQQRLIRKTSAAGTDHLQYVWILECSACDHRYGANGSDFHHRKCPKCQGGKPGLQVPA